MNYSTVYQFNDEDEIVEAAIKIVASRLKIFGESLVTPAASIGYLTLKTSHLEHEVFGMLLLNGHASLIADEQLFRGSLNTASVYPREVVKTALRHNAHSVILYHNHPGGDDIPSSADRSITNKIKDALAVVDVRVIDHIIIAGANTYSFAQNGDI